MKNRKKILAVILIVSCLMLLSTTNCFAADVGDQVEAGIKTAILMIRKIVSPIAIVSVMGCGIYCIFGSDPANIKKAKSWGIAIFIGLLIINLAEPIVTWASSIGAPKP